MPFTSSVSEQMSVSQPRNVASLTCARATIAAKPPRLLGAGHHGHMFGTNTAAAQACDCMACNDNAMHQALDRCRLAEVVVDHIMVAM